MMSEAIFFYPCVFCAQFKVLEYDQDLRHQKTQASGRHCFSDNMLHLL